MAADAADARPARLAFTALVAVAEAAHLGWEHLHGGIVSHHLLADPSLPAIWNGWGLLVLPALAWIASRGAFPAGTRGWRPDGRFLLRLLGAMLGGIALSIAFNAGRADVAGGVLLALAAAAMLVRGYRPECLLGFVLGMAFTFGALLPVLIGGIIALGSAIAWFALRPLAMHAGRGLQRRLGRA